MQAAAVSCRNRYWLLAKEIEGGKTKKFFTLIWLNLP